MTTIADAPPTTGSPAPLPAGFQPIDAFTAAAAAEQAGARLRLVREAATAFRSWFAATGRPDAVVSADLVSLPYPTRFGLFRAHLSPSPFLTITNRLVVVRWSEPDGRRRTLLWEPSDVELGANTPFFARMSKTMPKRLESMVVRFHGTVPQRLAQLGIAPEEVDWLCFDHLHTQDVRRWIGTNSPAPDISPDRPVAPLFPNARLIVQQTELDAIAELHPLQRQWYQPQTYGDLIADRILPVRGDLLLGPGVALLATPGHTIGNHSLVLNTDTGIWVTSENVIATECLTPEHSRIPGVRRHVDTWGFEVILNANTIEATAEQYNSCVQEKSIADRSRRDPRFLQFLPSSELTANRLNPGTSPTFFHGGIHHGSLG